ncbi:hypothetical protein WJX84_003699 [Apatococcus fuscideae]|uniref:Uncharacterized protein n=1 Tax=Apatococcus fuscideae TaxID=2026836 RepID=A0AAW1SUB5_9CHLO
MSVPSSTVRHSSPDPSRAQSSLQHSALEQTGPSNQAEPSTSGLSVPLDGPGPSPAIPAPGIEPGLEEVASRALISRHELAALRPQQQVPGSGPLSLSGSTFLPHLISSSYQLKTEAEKGLVASVGPTAQPSSSTFVGQLLGPDSVMIPAPETGAPQPPRDPTIITVHDRKVRDRDFYGRTPLYVLVRRWLQNDPDLEPVPIMPENAPVLPPPLPRPAEVEEPAPSEAPFPFDKSCGNAEGLMEWHKSHWLRVRQHTKVQSTKRKGRYKQRMELLNSFAQVPAETS